MRRTVTLTLAILMLLLLVACNPASTGNNEVTTGGATTTESTTAGTPDADNTPKKLLINGVDISNYKIVYPENPMAATYKKYPDLVTQDTEYDKQTAEALALKIKDIFGVELQVVKDTDVPAGTYEISVGETNREADKGSFSKLTGDKAYVVKLMKNGNLFLRGATFTATWKSVDEFIDNVMLSEGSEINLPADYMISGTANMLVVGCVGDSLTYGAEPSNSGSTVAAADRQSIVPYPMVLQRIEWKNMVVYNYGHSGRTMIENFMVPNEGSRSYIDSSAYKRAMENAKNIDLMLIMLGTNDGNETRATQSNYVVSSTAFETKFIASCKNLVDNFRSKNADMNVVLLNAPNIYSDAYINNLNNYIRPYQKKAADQLGLTLLDMYTYTKTIRPNYFPDKVHPKNEGYVKYAEGISTLLKSVVEGMLSE